MTEDRARVLLQDGRALDMPDADTLNGVNPLAAGGLIATSRTAVFPCRGAPDASRWASSIAAGMACWSPGGCAVPHHCEECGAEHGVDEDTEAVLSHRVRVRALREGVEARLDRLLRQADDRQRRMSDGVAWRVDVDGREVHGCVLDGSMGSRYITRAVAASKGVVYVVVDWRQLAGRFPQGLGEVLPLYRLMVDTRHLSAPSARRLADRIFCLSRSRRRCGARCAPRRLACGESSSARELVVTDKGAKLDGVEVLGNRAAGLLPILRFLVERWLEDLADGKDPDVHCCFTVAEIREGLRDEQGRAPTEGTVRKRLARLRGRIAKSYKTQTKHSLGSDAVVEHVDGLGYRLNGVGLSARLR